MYSLTKQIDHLLELLVEIFTESNFPDKEFETVVRGDEEMVLADKAYWSAARSQWCREQGVANGILRKASRGETWPDWAVRLNQALSRVRCGIERIFGWWKRSTGYRRVRYVGRDPNRLELEFKSVCWNLKRLVSLTAA